jgi:hypothetical protein
MVELVFEGRHGGVAGTVFAWHRITQVMQKKVTSLKN